MRGEGTSSRSSARAALVFASAGLLPLVALGAAVLSRAPGVAEHYRAHTSGISGLGAWIGWIGMRGAAFLAWEFFFRGLLVVGLARDLGGPLAVVLHLVPFTLVHVGKPALEVLLTIPGGLLFGALALRGRSMLGPFLLHWTLAASVDVWGNLGGLRADWRRPAEQYQGDRREDSQIKRRHGAGV